MANDYYFRQWSIVWGGQTLIEPTDGQDCKIAFKILHDSGGYVSYCDLSLYNLSANTMGGLSKKNQPISLIAGYLGLNGQLGSNPYTGEIFTGKVVNFIKERQGSDVIFRLFATGTGLRTTEPTIHKTLGENTNIIEIIKTLASALNTGLEINEEDFKSDPRFSYARGYTLNGGVRTILRKLANVHNFSWTVQSNDLVVVKGNKPTSTSSSIPIISMQTGMEGIPEITERGCTVTTKLRPDLRVGRMFKIESEFKTLNFSEIYYQNIGPNEGSGSYLLNKIEHTGDSHGNAWNTKLTGIRP